MGIRLAQSRWKGRMMHVKLGVRARSAVGVAVGAALLVAIAAGCNPISGNDDSTRASNAAMAEKAAAAKKGGLNCNETEHEYHNKGYIYLYSDEKCKGKHGERDNSPADRDHGDNQGQIKKWDNHADSIVNTTKYHIEFYNYPKYNTTPTGKKKGDRFCLGPGEWINRLQYYGDADGTKDWWRNSISSHRRVKPGTCTRWFGWGTDRK